MHKFKCNPTYKKSRPNSTGRKFTSFHLPVFVCWLINYLLCVNPSVNMVFVPGEAVCAWVWHSFLLAYCYSRTEEGERTFTSCLLYFAFDFFVQGRKTIFCWAIDISVFHAKSFPWLNWTPSLFSSRLIFLLTCSGERKCQFYSPEKQGEDMLAHFDNKLSFHGLSSIMDWQGYQMSIFFLDMQSYSIFYPFLRTYFFDKFHVALL